MTIEHQIVIGLTDIQTVTLECKSCNARLRVAPARFVDRDRLTTTECPSCGHHWFNPTVSTGKAPTSPLLNLLEALWGAILNADDKSVGVRVLFEFDGPTGPKP